MEQPTGPTDTPEPPLFRSRWVFPIGLAVAIGILALQSVQLWMVVSWHLEHGVRFEPGRARLQLIWITLILLSSGTAIWVWCLKRPDLPHKVLILIGCMLGLWVLTLPAAMVVSGILTAVLS